MVIAQWEYVQKCIYSTIHKSSKTAFQQVYLSRLHLTYTLSIICPCVTHRQSAVLLTNTNSSVYVILLQL